MSDVFSLHILVHLLKPKGFKLSTTRSCTSLVVSSQSGAFLILGEKWVELASIAMVCSAAAVWHSRQRILC